MKRIGILGAKSFIGKQLAVTLSNDSSLEIVKFARESSDGDCIPIDLSNKGGLRKHLKNFDVIYYLFSSSIPVSSWAEPVREINENLLPFMNFLEVASEEVTKVAFISSGGTVYGPTTGKVSEDAVTKPFSPYGIVKLTMENFLEYYRIKEGLNYDVYRVSNAYGPGQNTAKGLGVINTFLENIISTGRVKVYGKGDTTRNYIYVKDVAELLTLSVKSMDSSEIYNLSSYDTLDINSLLSLMKEIIPFNFDIDYEKGRMSDNKFIDLDNSKLLNRYNGFKFTPLEAGILETFEKIKQTGFKKT